MYWNKGPLLRILAIGYKLSQLTSSQLLQRIVYKQIRDVHM